MSRNLEARLAKLEAARGPAAIVQVLFAQTDAETDAQTAERIAKGTTKESDHFIVVRFVEAKDGRPVQCREAQDPARLQGEAQAQAR